MVILRAISQSAWRYGVTYKQLWLPWQLSIYLIVAGVLCAGELFLDSEGALGDLRTE